MNKCILLASAKRVEWEKSMRRKAEKSIVEPIFDLALIGFRSTSFLYLYLSLGFISGPTNQGLSSAELLDRWWSLSKLASLLAS